MRKAILAAAQITVKPGDKQANLDRIARWCDRARAAGAELVCFPELCTTGSTSGSPRDVAEPIPGPTANRLSALARDHDLWLVAGMVEADPDGGRPYNSAPVIDPAGDIVAVYRKIYLFSTERAQFARGHHPCLVHLPFGCAAVTICYDFIFPAYIAGLVDRGAELILHPTNWLTTEQWVRLGYDQAEYRAVAVARAVENTVWFLSANRWGPCDDSAAFASIGQSAIIAPWGRVVAEVVDGEGLALAEVDFDALQTWREGVATYLQDRRDINPWRDE